MRKVYIYGLVSSDDDVIKYVGKTVQKMKKRVHDHIRESYKLKTKKDKWLQDVISNNYNIEYKILDVCFEDSWVSKEKYWIDKIDDLTNTSPGGDGGRGLIYTKSYNEIKNWVHDNLPFIGTSYEWREYIKNNKLPKFIPRDPVSSYKKRGWSGWSDFLKHPRINSTRRANNTVFYPYSKAKEYVNKLNIKTSKEWVKYVKNNTIDKMMPTSPDVVYGKTNEWVSWGEFLGTGNKHNKDKKFLKYSKAKDIVSNFGLSKRIEWDKYIANNGLIYMVPRHPNRYYKKSGDWISWGDFLTK